MKSEVQSFTSLPEEITENILARISRWNYPKLSLVCKSFHSLLSSTNIYKTRSQIGTTETCLYVCLERENNRECFGLQANNNREWYWFSLQAKPSQTKTKTKLFKLKSSGHVLVPLPSSSSSNFPLTWRFSIIDIGWEIYFIGGSFNNGASSAVRVLDCRSQTWRDSPNMKVARLLASTVSLDDKIYVVGGCHYADSLEVFDIKTQSWTALPSPCALGLYSMVNVVQGKLHVVADEKVYMYDTKHGTWKVVSGPSISLSYLSTRMKCMCVVENVIYRCTQFGDYLWYDDSGCGDWKMVKGLEKLLENREYGFSRGRANYVLELVNFGGNILLMWESEHHVLWCAEISLERRCNGSEIWGNIEYADAMYSANCKSYYFQYSLAVSF